MKRSILRQICTIMNKKDQAISLVFWFFKRLLANEPLDEINGFSQVVDT
jgi:hypothetical protein